VPSQTCHGVTFTFTHVELSNAKCVSLIRGYFHSITYHVSKNIKTFKYWTHFVENPC